MGTAMQDSDHGFPLVEVKGTSYQMGYQHGTQAAELVRRYLLWIEKLTGKPRELLVANALSFEPAIEALSPSLLEEVRGLADGAGVSFEEALLCKSRAEAAAASEGACSAFALTGSATADGRPLAGQNQDLPADYSDVAILLHAKPTDGRPRALMFTFAGQLGYSGMNEYGLAHFANALYAYDWQPGLPHYPLKRVMLEQRGVTDCIGLLRRHATCSAANLVMCDGQGSIADVEVRPGQVAEYKDDRTDWRVHTNHYVTSDFARYEDNTLADSCPRLDRMRLLIEARWGTVTVETMKEVLADHQGDPAAICRHGDSDMESISGYIAQPAEGLLHVRRGHGCTGTWRAYEV